MTDFFLNGVKILRFNFESYNYKVKGATLELENGEIHNIHNFAFDAENSVIHQWSQDDVTQ